VLTTLFGKLNNMPGSQPPAFADLHLLTVLAETRSYTQAARRLGVSKASVSARITELERQAGLPLVHRTTRSVGLTQAGQQLVDDTSVAFERIAQSFSAVRDLAGAPRGLVRVTAPVALGRQAVMPVLPGFLARYPEIRLDLDLSDRFVNLAQEGFDVAIRHTQTPPESYVAWPLCATRSLLVASRAYLDRRGTPSRPSELAAHDCLSYLRGTSGQSWMLEREGARRAERVAVTVAGPARANNSEVLREAALSGLGIALLPDFSAVEHLHSGELVQVLPAWRPLGFFGDRIYALRPGAAKPPRAVQCLIDHLRSSLAGGFPQRR
jgi:DNA-binding transcriptional LysR family regulator